MAQGSQSFKAPGTSLLAKGAAKAAPLKQAKTKPTARRHIVLIATPPLR